MECGGSDKLKYGGASVTSNPRIANISVYNAWQTMTGAAQRTLSLQIKKKKHGWQTNQFVLAVSPRVLASAALAATRHSPCQWENGRLC